MDNQDSIIDSEIQQLHEQVKSLLIQNNDDATIISELSKKGVEPGYAELLIENVRVDIHNRKEFWKHIIIGSLIIASGVLVNFLSYWTAVDNGSPSFVIIVGVVVFGVIVLIRGMILFRK